MPVVSLLVDVGPSAAAAAAERPPLWIWIDVALSAPLAVKPNLVPAPCASEPSQAALPMT